MSKIGHLSSFTSLFFFFLFRNINVNLTRFRITPVTRMCNFSSVVKLADHVFTCVLKFVHLQGFEGRDSGLASVSTLASSLDFTSSKSWLRLLLPLASEMKDTSLNKF